MKDGPVIILFILLLICLTSKSENYGFGYFSQFQEMIASLFGREPRETPGFDSVGGVQEIKMGNVVLGQKRWYRDENGNIGEFNYRPDPAASMWAETPLFSADHMTD